MVISSKTSNTSSYRYSGLNKSWTVNRAMQVAMFAIVIWLTSAYFVEKMSLELVLTACIQAVLHFIIVYWWLSSGELRDPRRGLVISMLSLNSLMMYGITNIPAFISPRHALYNIEPLYYAISSGAAVIGHIGLVIGISIARKNRRSPKPGSFDSSIFPNTSNVFIAVGVIFAMFFYCTIRFGLTWGIVIDGSLLASHNTSVDLFVLYSVLRVLPFAPFLFSTVIQKAQTLFSRRIYLSILVVIILLNVGLLSIWRMRTWAMLSCLLPLIVLLRGKVIKTYSFVLLSCVGLIAAYFWVTGIRTSDWTDLVRSEVNSGYELDMSSSLKNLSFATFNYDNLLTATLYDLGNNRNGLTPVATILQNNIKTYGEAHLAEFLSVFPTALQVNSAGSINGIAGKVGALPPIDNVSTPLMGLVLDFGAFFLIFPAIFFGWCIEKIDHIFQYMIQALGLEWMKVIRLAWLMNLVFASSFPAILAIFFKSIIPLVILLNIMVLFFEISTKTKPFPRYRTVTSASSKKIV